MNFKIALRRQLRRGYKQTISRVERLGASITAYATWPLWKKARCLFILSTGRTGTKTLSRILDLSDEVAAFHEPRPQLMEERQSARWEVRKNETKYRHIFVRSRGAPLFQAAQKGLMYAETSARLTFFAPVIADLLPRSKFLFIHRHPSGLIRSGMKRGWYVDHPADYARVRPVEGERFFDRWDEMSPFEKICWYWTVYNDFALDFCEKTPSSNTLTIRASELFEGKAVPQIFDFLGIQRPSSETIEGVLSQKLNAQQEGTFPKANEWSPSMHHTLKEIAGDTMERLGYSIQETQVL